MEKYILLIILVLTFVGSSKQDGHDDNDDNRYLECNAAQGFHHLSLNKCVKVFYSQNGGLLSWHMAKDVCAKYGARLVTIKDQYDNDKLGHYVANVTGRADTSYWIGLSDSSEDNCSPCTELKWENGADATENMGYWADDQPKNQFSNCIFAQKNMEDYIYDRPIAWSYDNCYSKRAFVCEKEIATNGTFHCFTGGYVRMADKCNGKSDCADGSDELDCPGQCAFLLQGSGAQLNSFNYLNAQTCTWAIITEEGTSAFVELRNFVTEKDADYVNVFVGSIIETQATRVARISGTLGTQQFQSYNNMILIKFQSDSFETRTGFVGRYAQVSQPQDNVMNLIATDVPQVKTTEQDVGLLGSFVGMYDYVYVITTQNDQLGKIITLEILDMMINEDEFIEIYDGRTPDSARLARLCMNGCTNPKVIFSTGRQMSIFYRRMKSLSMDIRFSFRYTEGCEFTTTNKWGMFSSPGYPIMKYPNFVNCVWKIMPMEPFAVYFDMNLGLADNAFNLAENSDTLEMYDNGTRLHMADRGFNATELAGKTFQISSGILEVRFSTSPIRSDIGFNATYSIGCPNPNYDSFTISNTGSVDFYYTAKMTLTCAQGYAFQQEQIPINTLGVTVECGYRGVWENFLQIPRCTPVYCGDVPELANGYISDSTGVVFGGTVTYECFPGLSISGPTTITCQSNGLWSPGPACIVGSCPYNPSDLIINAGSGELTNGDGSTIGSIIEYECNAGWELVGEPILFCQANATYTSSTPSCKRLTCQLPMIMNGRYQFLNVDDFVDYEADSAVVCNTGYEFQNTSITSVMCMADRSVSELPVCIDTNECNNSPCSQDCTNTIGSFFCSCGEGYQLNANGFSCDDINECVAGTSNCKGFCDNDIGTYACGCTLPLVLYTANGDQGFNIPAGETGLLPTDTYHLNHSCVLIACPDPPMVGNGTILDMRTKHRYGDYVEYKCDVGFQPTSTVLMCMADGTWSGSPPTCQAATCTPPNPALIFPVPRNIAAYTTGDYSYRARLDLNCSKGGQEYMQFRHCTYDPVDDEYEFQGSPYDCGVIDCGPIEPQFANVVTDTIYPAQFVATCPPNYSLIGKGPDQNTSIVTCSADGLWQYGNLSCTGVACEDPGYPAGGDIIATSFARSSVVSFVCNRTGYTLSNDVTDLTCQGSSWSGSFPVNIQGCVDTEVPEFSGPCGSSITLDRYEFVPGKLPNISATDNTGVRLSTIFPENANYTLYIESPLTVRYQAFDYRNNDPTCEISINIRDETPPTILCPNLQNIFLDSEEDFELFDTIASLFTRNDNIGVQSWGIITPLPKTNFTITDLYETFTYEAIVRDAANNNDTCKGQVFVQPRPGCNVLGYMTPLNSVKTCTPTLNGLSCTITCDNRYTFQTFPGKTINVNCNNGVWDTEPIPACVQDRTKPDIICPSSQVIRITEEGERQLVDFGSLLNGVQGYSESDLNTISTRMTDPMSKNFTSADLYRTTEVTLTVEDLAENEAECRFQYNVLPSVCSPLSLPTPIFGKPNVCTRRSVGFTGYDCTLECQDGYVLRGHGNIKTISCDDGNPWPEIHPGCILDTTPPKITCPQSRTLYVASSADRYNVTFGQGNFVGVATDIGGIQSITYNPTFLEVSSALIKNPPQRYVVSMTAIDLADNDETCLFSIIVLPESCSDLAIPAPVNGNKSCDENALGQWTCTFACNSGYSFVTTTASTITSTCSPSGTFDTFVPSCVNAGNTNSITTTKQFIGTLTYRYQAKSDVLESCIQSYITQQNTIPSGQSASIVQRMAGRMKILCQAFKSYFVQVIEFQPLSFVGSVSSDVNGNPRVVTIDYKYSFASSNNISVIRNCSEVYGQEISTEDAFELGFPITDVATCPDLDEAFFANQTDANFFCPVPYFEWLQNRDVCVLCPEGYEASGTTCVPCPIGQYRPGFSGVQCVLCPEGYEASGTTCVPCPIGQYRPGFSGAQCQACPNGGSTKYPGATSSSQCLDVCTGGQISSTGFEPCYPCDLGYYRINSTYCQACPTGLTTNIYGATDQTACINTTLTNIEPCPAGTQSDGAGGCNLCDFGTYRTQFSGLPTCTSCAGLTTTYVQGATANSACIGLCGNGLISADGKPPCTACPKGTYYSNSTYCAPCSPGFSTVGTGAADSSFCILETILRVNCPKGTYRNSTTGDCMNCGIGTYQDTENQFSCKPCGNQRSTYVVGATSFSQCFETCAPGFRSDTGLSPCTPCGVGNYWVDATTCNPCTSGGTTSTETAESADECIIPCPAGYFSFSGFNQNDACRECPFNYYQPTPTSTSCIQCPDDTYTNQTALTSDALCLPSTNLCDNYCQNGGNCVTRLNGVFCECPTGFFGPTCSQVVNYCLSRPCYNGGDCLSSPQGHTCDCKGLATGPNCENIIPTCVTTGNPTCRNSGHCINRPGYSQCLCPDGFSGATCEQQANICDTKPCNATGSLDCEDSSFGFKLRRRCICKPGYRGDDCSININDCESKPCVNGGNCQDLVNGFFCQCANGYTGTYCEIPPNRCNNVNCGFGSMCADKQMDQSSHCVCAPGYTYGTYDQYSIRLSYAPQSVTQSCSPGMVASPDACRVLCSSNPTCAHFAYQPSSGNCCLLTAAQAISFVDFTSDPFNLYTKNTIVPLDDFYTEKYDLGNPTGNSLRDSESRLTMNNQFGLNVCGGTVPLEATCCVKDGSCARDNLPGDLTCNVNGLTCNGVLCQNTDYEISFKCAVQRVFLGNTCSLKTDYCNSNPCDRGTCSYSGSTGYGYFCSCPLGYSGRDCQTDINECANMPCQNGATCTDAVNGYSCNCTEGFQGVNCQSRVDYCQNVNCNNRGICSNLDTEPDYQCTCFQGYEGKDCENEINRCRSNPCLLNSNCTAIFNDYVCECVPGWTGKNCDEVVNNCNTVNGLQCQADCKNIFNDYYCECPANTFGENCQNQPDPCNDYNKCQNNATCSVDMGTMNCACPTKYTGDGCQILVNHCGQTNLCENDAMCMVTDMGYQCTCPNGYTGTNCEEEINECTGVICPGNGQCFDAIGTHYCRCPLKTTGENCARAYDTNYDIYIGPHPKAYAWIPYFIQVLDTDRVSASFWVRYSVIGGEGIYMTQYIGDALKTSVKFMELTHEGLIVYGADPNNRLNHLMQFTRNSLINDGNWHLVTFSFDTVQGEMKLYLDTIFHAQYNNAGIALGVTSFRMWLILGCQFDKTMQMCKGTENFHGYLSQINWYRKILGFVEVDQIFQNPRIILDDPMDEVILLFNEYVLESGSDRVIPSQASGVPCSDPTRPIPCSFFTVEQMPMVTGCPNDIVVNTNGQRQVTVTWTEPTFSNLGNTGITTRPMNQSGNTYSWGISDVAYVGISDMGFTAYCTFRIYVQEMFCPIPENPFSGREPACVDNNPMGRRGCRISCYDGFVIDRITPRLFTCDPTGTWNYAQRFEKYRYPACGQVRSVSPRLRVTITFVYQIGTTACIAAKQNLNELFEATLASLNNAYAPPPVPGVPPIQLYDSFTINIDCGNENSGRKRRQTATTTAVTIVLNNADPRSTYNESISVEEFLTYQAIGLNVFDYPLIIFRSTILEELFSVTAVPACGANEVVINGQCVECGGGNFFRYTGPNNTMPICDDCPIGSYQPASGQFSCTPCADGETTELPGAYNSDACKTSCSVGFFFNRTADTCSPCPIGYYQDEEGKFQCKGCAAGFTTEFVGTNSSVRCTGICDNGQQLDGNGNCELCPIGTYRNVSESRLCRPCTAGLITSGTGAKSSAECTVTACEPGNRLNTQTNACEQCPVGTYQDEKWQTNCESCGDPTRFLTLTAGSSSPTDCIFYCQPGFEVIQNTQTCKTCDIGTYKVGNLGVCTPCTGNYRTPNVASTSPANCTIFKCPIGFSPNTTNNGCSPCEVGTYQDVAESESCKVCGTGNSTRQEGSTSPNDCEVFCVSGQQKVQGTCVPCDRGTYKNNMDGVFSMCQDCNANYTTVGMASISADNCTIRACPAGTRRNGDDTACIDCPLGRFQNMPFMTMCQNCTSGTSTRQVGANSSSLCEQFCVSGQQKNGIGGCDACERGYYKDNNDGVFGTCQLCPTENITQTVGATKLSDCIIGNCTAGQRLRTDNTCENCPKGTYQSNKWQTSCFTCGTDKTTQFEGSTSENDCILVCQPGFEDVGGVCQLCPQGFFKVEEAAAKCNPCPNDTITESTGANSSALCVLPACGPGFYLDRNVIPQNSVCRPCGYDTYQNEKWQESCKPCQTGEVTLKTGAMSVTDCVADCQSGQEYNANTGACDFCPIGYYRDKTDRSQASCQLCPIQSITAAEGSTSQNACNIANCTTPGEYRDTSDNTCKQCPIGQFQNIKWQTSCQSCGAGFSTRSTGSTSSSDCIPVCPLGQVVGTNNQCEDCPVGFYKSSATAENCTQCPNRLLTPRAGSDSENDCSLSPCSAGQSYDLTNLICNDCPIGTYQPSLGAFSCITCENGYGYTPTTRATSAGPCGLGKQFNNVTKACVDCPLGYYQNRVNQFMCERCPEGLRYTENTGSTAITQCLSFCSGPANPCSENATCNTATNGAVCTCFPNHDDIGSVTGTQCVHVCDRGYCLNDRPCSSREPPTCLCGDYLEGDRCETRTEGQNLSDDTNKIIIGVSVGAGGLILCLIILAVCCLCWMNQRKAANKPPTRYSEFNGDRIDKASLQSYDYGMRPYNGGTPRLMLASQEFLYDNQGYYKEDNLEGNGSIDAAVYHA